MPKLEGMNGVGGFTASNIQRESLTGSRVEGAVRNLQPRRNKREKGKTRRGKKGAKRHRRKGLKCEHPRGDTSRKAGIQVKQEPRS